MSEVFNTTQMQLMMIPGDNVTIPNDIDLQNLDLTSPEALGPGNKFCCFSEFMDACNVLIVVSDELCDEITDATGDIVSTLASGCGISITDDVSAMNNILKNLFMLYMTEPDPRRRFHRVNAMIDECAGVYTFEDAYSAIKRGSIIYAKTNSADHE